MTFRTPLDAEIPVSLTRADADRTRRRFYAVTGWPRNDELLPKQVPPGAGLLQSEDGNPAHDVAVPAHEWGNPSGGSTDFGRWRSRCGTEELQRRFEQLKAWTRDVSPIENERRRLLALGEDPVIAFARAIAQFDYDPRTVGVTLDFAQKIALWSQPWHVCAYFEEMALAPWDYTVVHEGETVRLTSSSLSPYRFNLYPRAPTRPVRVTDEWWYGTPWGQERILFFPPAVLGQFGWEPALAYALSPDSFVLVRYPEHPYIVGMPEPDGGVTGPFPTSSGAGDGVPVPVTRGRYRSTVILVGQGDRQEPRPYFADPALGWLGFYEDEPSTSDWGQVVSFVARNAALQAVVVAAAAVLTYGAGAAAVSGSLAGAVAGGATSAPAALAGAVVSAAAPEDLNGALAEVASAAPLLDLVPYVGELADVAFTELVIRAQTTRTRQDELRLELARRRQELVSQPWFGTVKQAVQVALTIVVNLAAPGLAPLEAALIALTKFIASAVTMGAKLLAAKEVAEAAAREAEERDAAHLAALAEEETALLAETDALIREIEELQRQLADATAATAHAESEPEPDVPPAAPPDAPDAPAPGMFARLAAAWGGLSAGQKVAGAIALGLAGVAAKMGASTENRTKER